MRGYNKFFFIVLILVLVFIALGDRFLPGALGQASKQTRTSINQFLIGLVPDKAPNVNEDRQKELEDLEQGQGSDQ